MFDQRKKVDMVSEEGLDYIESNNNKFVPGKRN